MQDMASLLAEESMKEFNPHDVIEGTVVLVNRDEAYVDVGFKLKFLSQKENWLILNQIPLLMW